jgi:hypothetical protein
MPNSRSSERVRPVAARPRLERQARPGSTPLFNISLRLWLSNFYCLPGRANCALQINRVPENDGRDHKIQPAGAMPLVLMRAIPQFAQAVEEYRPGQRVFCFSFIEPDMDALSQFDAADVLKQEHRALNLAEFSQGQGQAVLPGVGGLAPLLLG